MLQGIEALLALDRYGTISEAATQLRLTQSAVTKRLQALQDEVGFSLTEPAGRKVRLTADGLEFLERARPLYAELKSLAARPATAGRARLPRLTLAMAESIAASWGPGAVRETTDKLTESLGGFHVELHVHRGALVVESVRSGRYQAGVCADADSHPDLVSTPIAKEPMALVRSRLAPRLDRDLPLVTIEATSSTWRAIEPQLKARRPELLKCPRLPVESFSAALQMVKAGFGNGLIPLGLCQEARLKAEGYSIVSGVERPIAILARKTVTGLGGYQAFRDGLARAVAKLGSLRADSVL